MLKVPKIIRFHYLRNIMLDYLDFWYVHRRLSYGNNLLAILKVSKITNLQYLRNGMFDCHEFIHADRHSEFRIGTTIMQ